MPTAMNVLPVHCVPNQSRAARDSAAPSASGWSGTRFGKRRTPALERGVRERRLVGRGLGGGQMRTGARHQLAERHVGIAVVEGAPVEKALRQRRVAGGERVFMTSRPS